MRVLLVSSWGNRCGIAEYAALLKEGVERAPEGDGIEIEPSAEALDPEYVLTRYAGRPDLVHLNHHDALHSRWTPAHVQAITEKGIPVLLTYHDTREKLADCPKLQAMAQVCSSAVVHEEVAGLNAIYWRQGVPAPASGPYVLGIGRAQVGDGRNMAFKAFLQQPVLGSIGFNFPWKNFDRLAEETGKANWALMLIAHDATIEHEAHWRALNPNICVIREFVHREEAIALLSACDATAFMYECSNTGTSAAIRQGIAARKPLLAFSHCRQFRDLLQLDYTGDPDRRIVKTGITWCDSWAGFHWGLQTVWPMRWDANISALAEGDSWKKLGASYAQLYRVLVGVPGSTI